LSLWNPRTARRLELRSRRRKSGEKAQELAQDIEYLVALAYPEAGADTRDVLAREAFIEALGDPGVAYKIREKGPYSLQEAVIAAMKLEVLRDTRVQHREYAKPRQIRNVQANRSDGHYADNPSLEANTQAPTNQVNEEQGSLRRKIIQQDKEMKNLKRNMANLTKQRNGLVNSANSETPIPVASATNSSMLLTDHDEVEGLKQQLAKAQCQIFELKQQAMNCPDVPTPDNSYYGSLPSQQQWGRSGTNRQPMTNNVLPKRYAGATGNQSAGGQAEGGLAYRALCFNCGQPGHFKRSCPQYNSKSQVQPLPDMDGGHPSTFRTSNSRVAGTSLPGKAPVYLKIKVRHRYRLCLLDTGSDTTLIPSRLVGRHLIYKTDQRCVAANGSSIPIIGTTTVSGVIGNKMVKITGLVSDHVLDLMLGADWLQENDITWSFSKGEVYIDGETFKLRSKRSNFCQCRKVVLSENVTVPPRSQMDVTTKAVFEDFHSAEDVYTGNWGTEALEVKSGLLSARTLLPDRLDDLPVRLLNTSDNPITLEKDTTISPLVPLVAASVTVDQPTLVKDELSEESIIEDLVSVVDPSITEHIKESLKEILQKYSGVFSKGEWDLGWTDTITHSIDTGDHKPFRQPMRRYPPAHLKAIDDHLNDMLHQGVISPASSPWASNIVLAKKKDGTYRCCIDFRQLNNLTKKDAYPLPRTDACFDALSGSCIFSTFDLRSGYHQVAMNEEDSEKTAFITRRGMFKFRTMPFGLSNAVATFQRLMDLVLSGLNLSICLAYLDDIVLFSRTPEEHLQRLELLLQRLKAANLKLKPSECKLMQTEISFLGHIVSKDGISTDPSKIQLIKDWPVPRNIKELRGYLGLTGYYRKFIHNYSQIVTPLNQLLKKNRPFEWDEQCQASFDDLKEKMQRPPVLTLPNYTDTFVLDTDASGDCIGAVLSQIQDGQERVVAFAGRALTTNEKNYCVTRKELLAVVYFLKYFRQYLLGRSFIIRTDHAALTWLKKTPEPIGQNARWVELLEEYTFQIQHRPGDKH